MTSDYCGFICSDYVEKAKEIRKALDEFAKHNPEEAANVEENVLKGLGWYMINATNAGKYT